MKPSAIQKIIIAAALAGLTVAAPALAVPTSTILGGTYCTPSSTAQLFDFYPPASSTPTPWPMVIYIHGGAWKQGNRLLTNAAEITQMVSSTMVSTTASGIAFASIEYRLATTSTNQFPVQIQDTKCAIRYFRANSSTYAIDPNRILLLGGSSGAHLAELACYTGPSSGWDVGDGEWSTVPDTGLRGCLNLWSSYDLTASDWSPTVITNTLNLVFTTTTGAFASGSPSAYITTGAPPELYMQGALDELVPPTQEPKAWNQRQALTPNYVLSNNIQMVQNALHDLVHQTGTPPINPGWSTITAQWLNFITTNLLPTTKIYARGRFQANASTSVYLLPLNTSALRGTQASGTFGSVLSGPYNSNWWQVRFDSGLGGWANDATLQYPVIN